MAKDNKLDRIGEKLELPFGLLCACANIELHSNREACIDGRCSVLEYSDSVIRINTGRQIIEFIGKNLRICSLTPNSAIISGIICSLNFLD